MSSTVRPDFHKPVLLDEVIQSALFLEGDSGEVFFGFDGTFGRGGHSSALLKSYVRLRILAFDQDAEALSFAESHFSSAIETGRLTLKRSNFSELEFAADWLTEQMGEKFGSKKDVKSGFDFMLFDLGVSSPQLDQAERGFSFYHDGPLDMRMDDRRGLTAAQILNEWSDEELRLLFQKNGEIRFPQKVVAAIVRDRIERPFQRTSEFAGLVERVDGWAKKGFHPATQYFQALRMEVNAEIDSIADMLPKAMRLLAPGGRLAIITFHSLEDRLVKSFFRDVEDSNRLGENFGESLRRKPTVPTEAEIKNNSRARSAKLRIFRRYLVGEVKPPKNKYAHLAKNPGRERADDDTK